MEIDVTYRDSTNQLAAYREQIAELRRKMRDNSTIDLSIPT